jgi:predicted nucleic acid-binding protein
VSLVLDCSVAMSWCFEEEASDDSDRVLDALQKGEALVPSVWPLEVANVLVMAERRGRLKAGESARFLELLQSLPIFVEEVSLPRATGAVLSIARELDLSVYDASYLELAMRSGVALATHDLALARAADTVGVPRF